MVLAVVLLGVVAAALRAGSAPAPSAAPPGLGREAAPAPPVAVQEGAPGRLLPEAEDVGDADDPGTALQERADAVRALLDRRAQAVLARDAAALLATVDPTVAGVREEQEAWLRALADVPFSSFAYELDPAGGRDVPPVAGAEETWSPAVRLRYALEGVDREPTVQDAVLVLARRDGAWGVAATSAPGAPDPRANPWDHGRVVVHRGERSLVLGHPGDEDLLGDVARLVDDAVPAVTRVWGEQWAQTVQVVVPADAEEARAVSAADLDLDRVAAVTTAVLRPGAAAVGARVVLVPGPYGALSPLARQVVLTHEVAHVATRDATGDATPLWLAEGFADLVAYDAVDVPPRRAAAELAREVRAGRVPAALPTVEDFRTAGERLPAVYEAAWRAVVLVEERAGRDGLLAFYRQVAGAEPGDVDAALTRAWSGIGTTREEFVRDWRAAMVRDLG